MSGLPGTTYMRPAASLTQKCAAIALVARCTPLFLASLLCRSESIVAFLLIRLFNVRRPRRAMDALH